MLKACIDWLIGRKLQDNRMNKRYHSSRRNLASCDYPILDFRLVIAHMAESKY